MATVRFQRKKVLINAMNVANLRLVEAGKDPANRTANLRQAQIEIDRIQDLINMIEFSDSGTIYLDQSDVNLLQNHGAS